MNAAPQLNDQPAVLPIQTPAPQPPRKPLPATEPVSLLQPVARLTLVERVARRRPYFRKLLQKALSA
jgi:hypothetical protein